MKCAICREGQTKPGSVTATLERNGVIVIIKSVPAMVCNNCGEEYIEKETSSQLLEQAEESLKSGKSVDVRTFAA